MNDIAILIIPSILETLYMVFISLVFTIILGLPLGVILVVTGKDHILPNSTINIILSYLINITRSLPFVILMIFIIPFTRILVGTTIGTTAAIVPLVFAATPFFARVVESSIHEVDKGVIEASIAMGANPLQIILKVLIPESLASLVSGVTITIISIIGYSAMAGVVGGGGLGDLSIRYGYHRFETGLMFITVLILIILVQIIQSVGSKFAQIINKNRR